MNLTVFGANGRVGRLVVERALRSGHRVLAFVHSHDPFDAHPDLEVRSGDVHDVAAVAGAVAGADAVVSTLGTFRRGTRPVLASGVRGIGAAMASGGVARLVVLTGAGVVAPGRRGDFRTAVNRGVLRLMDRTAVPDVDEAVALLAASDLRWSVVCAPTITLDGDDSYRLTDRMPSLLGKVAGPAVAASLVDLAVQPGPVTNPVVGVEQGA